MWRFYALVAAVWVALMPPLFTGGACTREFDAENEHLARDGAAHFATAERAAAYFRARSVPVSLITLDQCRQTKPRFLDRCGSGPLVYAKVPVNNTICHLYRDEDVKVLLHYNELGRLQRFSTDMAPFKTLVLPLLNHPIHWAR